MKQQLRLAETCRPSPGGIAPNRGQLRTSRPEDNEVIVRPTGRAAGAGRLLRVHPIARSGVRPLETDAAGRHFPRRAASGEQSEGKAPCRPCSPDRNPHRLSWLPVGPCGCHVFILAIPPSRPCSRERSPPPPPPRIASSDSLAVVFASLQCDGDARCYPWLSRVRANLVVFASLKSEGRRTSGNR